MKITIPELALVVLVGRARVALARSVAGTVDVSVAAPTDAAGA